MVVVDIAHIVDTFAIETVIDVHEIGFGKYSAAVRSGRQTPYALFIPVEQLPLDWFQIPGGNPAAAQLFHKPRNGNRAVEIGDVRID